MRWPWWRRQRAQPPKASRKSEAPGAGDGQGYPGRGVRSPICNGNDIRFFEICNCLCVVHIPEGFDLEGVDAVLNSHVNIFNRYSCFPS